MLKSLPGLCALLLIACPASDAPRAGPGPGERPNILLIVTDDMGYTDLGAFGGHDIATPNLDRRALEGLRLANFHASPSCAPTRAMLMSGTGNHEAGLGTQLDYEEFRGERNYERFLQPHIATLPEVLRASGYHTVMSGKWHIGAADESDATLPSNRGFVQAFALLQGGEGHVHTVYDPPQYSEDGSRLAEPLEDFYSTTLYVDKLIEKLEARGDGQPFFAWFAPTAPHWPLQAPPGWLERYRGKYDEGFDALCAERMRGARAAGVLPDAIDTTTCPKEEKAWEALDDETRRTYLRVMEVYAAMVEHLDLETARLIDYLDEADELDNTWILYMNDNGPQGGGFRARSTGTLNRQNRDDSLDNIGKAWSWTNIGKGWADAISAPYRDSKASHYEGGIRVPAFAWHRDVGRGGEVDLQLLTAMDIMPTVLELAGANAPEGTFAGREVHPMRGKSFVPVLSDEGAVVHPDTEAIALDSAGRSVVMKGDWKAVRELYGDWGLFNMTRDPGETRDVAASEPGKLAELVADFEKQARESNFIRRRQNQE